MRAHMRNMYITTESQRYVSGMVKHAGRNYTHREGSLNIITYARLCKQTYLKESKHTKFSPNCIVFCTKCQRHPEAAIDGQIGTQQHTIFALTYRFKKREIFFTRQVR
jgi:hypothetical protein